MTYAAIVRADDGGVGNQLAEHCAHVPPVKALIVNPGGRQSRGTLRPERYAHISEVRIFDGDVLDREAIAWVCDGVDTLWSVECFYSPHVVSYARSQGVKTLLHANPELLTDEWLPADQILLPTSWEAARVNDRRARIRMPEARYLPVPINRAVLPERPAVDRLPVLFHPTASAMLDRNGTLILLAALRYCRHPFRVLIRGQRQRVNPGRCQVEWLPPCENYWEYPDADLMVLPRRYGGLSLSCQEAASVGMPSVMLDLEPARGWLDPAGLVACSPARTAGMRGGQFQVWDADPRALARRLDDLADHPEIIARMRDRALRWAESLDWENGWSEAYARVLGMR